MTVMMWGQHGDNVRTTGIWRPCGDNMETTWGQHGDNMRTMWRQHGDSIEPQGCGDHVGTMWRQQGDNRDVETMWGQQNHKKCNNF